MPSALSKRQQARNERALQELITTIPGNDRCADCGARNPGWASWSLGVFLCMRCAALHRKLGTHISKVKSLSMDTWSSEQVDFMRSHGNNLVNKMYNPKNVKPPIPLDVDEVDAAMERFIRQKYQEKSLIDGKPKPPSRDDMDDQSQSHGHGRFHLHSHSRSHDRSQRSSTEDSPPPLPPKKGKIFGFGLRTTSSAFPASNSDRLHLPLSPTMNNAFHINKNAQSKIDAPPMIKIQDKELDAKLSTLRDMGFPDHKRNEKVLKGLGGDLERTIESLVRLGEGSQPGSRSRTPVTSPRVTPLSGEFPQDFGHSKASSQSNNPFDLPSGSAQVGLSFAQPETQQQATSQPQQSHSYNPFDMPSQQSTSVQGLDQAFQSLQLHQQQQQQQQQQPLFPHSTGGYPNSQPQMPATRFQQSMTPPVPSQQYGYAASPPATNGNYNPFFQPQPQQTQMPSNNPYSSPGASIHTSNPFFTQSSGPFNPSAQNPPNVPFVQRSQTISEDIFAAQPPQQYQQAHQTQMSIPSQNFFQSGQSHQQASVPQQQQFQSPFGTQQGSSTASNAPSFNSQPQSQPRYQQQPQQQQQYSQPQQQSLFPQQTGRVDKSSILALYNQPQLSPQHLPTIYDVPTPGIEGQPAAGSSQAAPNPLFQMAKRSVTMPVAPNVGSRNPFLPSGGPPVAGISGHASKESVDVSGLGGGRHSPDAFASLSARYVR